VNRKTRKQPKPNKRFPAWFNESKSKTTEFGNFIASIESSGKEDINRGQAKLRYAATLKKDQEFLSVFFAQDIDPEILNNKKIAYNGQRLLHAIDSLFPESSGITTADFTSILDSNSIPTIRTSLSSTDISSASAVYFARSIDTDIKEIDPFYRALEQAFPVNRFSSGEESFTRLRNELNKLGESFVLQLDGSKAALENNTADNLSQAAHSMRDCFEFVIKSMAPDEKVKSQNWYTEVEGAPGGVSRRQRLRLIYNDSSIGASESVLQKIDQNIQDAIDALNECIKQAHLHDPAASHDFVKNAIELAQSHLLTLIDAFKETFRE